jgi:hypothetical protein
MLRMTTLSWAPRAPRLVLVLALGLPACGGDDGTADDANDSAPTASDPTNDSSSATADDDATVDASADDDATVDASADDDGSSGVTSMDSSGDATQTMSDGTMTMTTTLDTGESSTGGGGIDECTESDPLCSDGQMCRASKCCPDAGFCVFAAAPTCGGFVGEPCPDGLVCVLDQCVADGQGRCVDSDTATAIEEAQPGCWTAG